MFAALGGHQHLSSCILSLLAPLPQPWPQWTREETPHGESPISQVQSPTHEARGVNVLPPAVLSKLLNSQAFMVSWVLLCPAHKDGLLWARSAGLTPQGRVTHTQQGLSEKKAVILQKSPQSLSPRNLQSSRPGLCQVPRPELKHQ